MLRQFGRAIDPHSVGQSGTNGRITWPERVSTAARGAAPRAEIPRCLFVPAGAWLSRIFALRTPYASTCVPHGSRGPPAGLPRRPGPPTAGGSCAAPAEAISNQSEQAEEAPTRQQEVDLDPSHRRQSAVPSWVVRTAQEASRPNT